MQFLQIIIVNLHGLVNIVCLTEASGGAWFHERLFQVIRSIFRQIFIPSTLTKLLRRLCIWNIRLLPWNLFWNECEISRAVRILWRELWSKCCVDLDMLSHIMNLFLRHLKLLNLISHYLFDFTLKSFECKLSLRLVLLTTQFLALGRFCWV